MTSPFTSTSAVRFHHTDPASYVFFPRYFEMIQAAVEDWFTIALGINYADLINHDRVGFPTVRTECDFHKPSRLGDSVELTIYVERLGGSSITVQFVGRVKGEERLRARSVLVAISLEDGRPRPLDPALRVQIDAYIARQGTLPPAHARDVKAPPPPATKPTDQAAQAARPA